ncbi:RagB/SusD family nutrient uptake outer membrane protein [Sphingobacterium sp. LRF_L2]|uniref:RagB/SusD family nutrient uptake outer membrane protein n=1 Tax=Sphingobacterium sp. LRF_L2 TaxID=3369421 RepID=UPI003F64405F
MKLAYKFILTAFMTGCIFWSCDGKLDIEPEQEASEELALISDENVKKVLNGSYNELSDEYFYGGIVQLFSELLTSTTEIRWEGTFNQPREVFNKSILTTNSFVSSLWLQGYDAINIANNVLSALDVVNEDDRDVVEGQALFVRAVAHFELVRLFAKPYSAGNTTSNPGIPIKLIPTREINEESYVARSPVEDVYAQILDDLITAEEKLENSSEVAVAQKTAAAAMLSRVYLQMENYEEARDAANRAINYNQFTVESVYAKTFNKGKLDASDSETVTLDGIFQMPVSAQDGANEMHIYWSITAYGARAGDVAVLPAHLALYDQSTDGSGAYLDHRLALFYRGEGNSIGTGDWRSGKWKFLNSNLSVVRLSEMYLTRAECNLRLGTAVGATALEDINYIRGLHTALPALTSIDLNGILLERKLELAHEGQGIHDIKRIKGSVDGVAYDDVSLLLPIPQREIDASNGVLVQN